MDVITIVVFVVGLALGGVGGFFVGSGRTMEVNTTQHTELVNTTIQNQSQVTIVGKDMPTNVAFVVTNIRSRRDFEAWITTLDAFQLSHCEIVVNREWFNSSYMIIYPVVSGGSTTNTTTIILTNTKTTNDIRLK